MGLGILILDTGTLRSLAVGGEVLLRIGDSFRGVALAGSNGDDSGVGDTGDGMFGIDTGLRFWFPIAGIVSLRDDRLS